MFLILTSVVIFCLCGLASLGLGNRPRAATLFGAGGPVAGGVIGLIPSIGTLITSRTEELRYAWDVPYGSLYLQIDPLTSFFLLPILAMAALAALYGSQYMTAYRDRKNLGSFWFFFNLLEASMTLLTLARNGVLFLMFWELMSLSSFFLVTFENEQDTVRRAGWVYLVATHLGTAFLFALFLLLGQYAGTTILDFDRFQAAQAGISPVAGVAFLLAVVGFGTKAGFIPFHVWLPEAHPAAPSHVSAVMSGVMIKTGIYGLLRVLGFLGPPSAWWGWLLLAVGLSSGILGVLFALSQHDLKRLLAFHSVENIGIIALGLGLGVLGLSLNVPVLAVLGFAGGMLHVINHALFKGLLFLGAGAVAHATGTRDIDHLGGLIKRMPVTAVTFLVGSVAICGLPPLNGFVSEFLIYLGAFGSSGLPNIAAPCVLAIIGLALIGGLAAACFAKVFGIVFLGEPRSEHAARGHEAAPAMKIPMVILALCCVLIGFLAPLVPGVMSGVVTAVTGLPLESVRSHLDYATASLTPVVSITCTFVLLIALLAWFRCRLLSKRTIGESGTWDCGYARPTARMQYTASSFAQPLTRMFAFALRPAFKGEKVEGLFPLLRRFRLRNRRSLPPEALPPALSHRRMAAVQAPPLPGRSRAVLYPLYRSDDIDPPDLEPEMIATDISSYVFPVLALCLAPLLSGIINRTKAFFGGRTGQPLLQLYYDLARLLRKGAVYSRTTSWIFRAGPLIGLASTATALLLLPVGGSKAAVTFPGDLLLLAYLLGVMRFFTVLAALDTGSAFEGMGASREVQFSALAEPALFLGLAALARAAQAVDSSCSTAPGGFLSLSAVYSRLSMDAWLNSGPALLLVAGAILVVFLAENSRIPFDDPEHTPGTHHDP